jgi:hypothetical protein
MTDIHDAVTYADVRNFELGINTKCFNTWFYKTDHPLEDVLGPNYFDSIIDAMPRRNDRIEVLASCNRLLPEHATLAIKDVVVTSSEKHVMVTLLHKCER